MQEKNMPRADFVTSVLLTAFGIAVFVLSYTMPRLEEQNINPYSAPGVVPMFLGAVNTLLGLVLFVRSLVRRGHHLGINGATIKAFFTADMSRRVVLTVGLSVAYGLLLGRVPYAVATGLYILAFILLFEYRWRDSLRSQLKGVAVALLIAVLASGAVAATFRYVFLVNLP